MRRLARFALAAVGVACLPSIAAAKVRIAVDLDTQTMHVESKDKVFDWKVSSGAAGYDTPTGSYGVLWMDKDHKSDEYDGAPMPNAIFFKPGFAIHGSPKSNWGHPASHGCIRLPVAKSAILFGLVKAEGAEVTITGGEVPATVEARATHRIGAPSDPDAGYADRGYFADPYGSYGYRDAPVAGYEAPPATHYDGFYGSPY